MNTNSKQLIFLLCILFVSIVIAGITFWPSIKAISNQDNESLTEESTSDIKRVRVSDGSDVYVAIADTDAKREQGLSGVEKLENDTGMLFLFEKPGRYSFWMKDMNFPIDIIWIDEQKTIINIEKNISPDTFPQLFGPSHNALYVLEVSAGFSDRHGLQVADQVTFL